MRRESILLVILCLSGCKKAIDAALKASKDGIETYNKNLEDFNLLSTQIFQGGFPSDAEGRSFSFASPKAAVLSDDNICVLLRPSVEAIPNPVVAKFEYNLVQSSTSVNNSALTLKYLNLPVKFKANFNTSRTNIVIVNVKQGDVKGYQSISKSLKNYFDCCSLYRGKCGDFIVSQVYSMNASATSVELKERTLEGKFTPGEGEKLSDIMIGLTSNSTSTENWLSTVEYKTHVAYEPVPRDFHILSSSRISISPDVISCSTTGIETADLVIRFEGVTAPRALGYTISAPPTFSVDPKGLQCSGPNCPTQVPVRVTRPMCSTLANEYDAYHWQVEAYYSVAAGGTTHKAQEIVRDLRTTVSLPERVAPTTPPMKSIDIALMTTATVQAKIGLNGITASSLYVIPSQQSNWQVSVDSINSATGDFSLSLTPTSGVCQDYRPKKTFDILVPLVVVGKPPGAKDARGWELPYFKIVATVACPAPENTLTGPSN